MVVRDSCLQKGMGGERLQELEREVVVGMRGWWWGEVGGRVGPEGEIVEDLDLVERGKQMVALKVVWEMSVTSLPTMKTHRGCHRWSL